MTTAAATLGNAAMKKTARITRHITPMTFNSLSMGLGEVFSLLNVLSIFIVIYKNYIL